MLPSASARCAAPLQVGTATVKIGLDADGTTPVATSDRASALIAERAQGLPGEEARGMAVVPCELHGVRADILHPDQLQVGPNRGRIQHPLAGPLVATGGAGTLAPEEMVTEAVDAIVGPGHFEDLIGLKRPDVRGRIAHWEGSREGPLRMQSRQVFEVSEILRPAGCTLVGLQVLPADDRDRNPIDDIDNAMCIRLREIDPRDSRQDFDSNRFTSHPSDLVWTEEEIG